ncbi:hypothetical protein JCM11251_004162 [Rhodosporidiobolus azoricus]
MPCCSQCWSTWAQNLLTDYAWPILLAAFAWVFAGWRRATTTTGAARVGDEHCNGVKNKAKIASPVDLTSTVPPDSLASPTEPLDSDVTDDSFVPPETAGTSPATESVSGSDPAELDSFLSGEGEDGDSSLSGLGSGINAATSGTPGDFGNSSTSDPTALLSSLGFSPDDIAAAQSQQNAQNSPLTGLSWPSSLDGVSSAADPSTGASGDPAVAPVVGATSPAS